MSYETPQEFLRRNINHIVRDTGDDYVIKASQEFIRELALTSYGSSEHKSLFGWLVDVMDTNGDVIPTGFVISLRSWAKSGHTPNSLCASMAYDFFCDALHIYGTKILELESADLLSYYHSLNQEP